jgi:hypothetical protein
MVIQLKVSGFLGLFSFGSMRRPALSLPKADALMTKG